MADQQAPKSYLVTAPNGRKVRITPPPGATPEQVLAKAKEFVDANPLTPAEAKSMDREMGVKSGGRNAVAGMADSAVDAMKTGLSIVNPAVMMGPAGQALRMAEKSGMSPGEATKGALPGQDYDPTTPMGKYGKAFMELSPNLLVGPEGSVTGAVKGGLGGLARLGAARSAQVAVPAATQELAGAVAQKAGAGPKGVQGAKLAGALAGGVVAQVPQGASQKAKIVTGAAEGATPQQLADAMKLGQKAKAMDVPLTMAEGVQAKAPATRMNKLARAIEASPQGAPISARMAERPAKVRAAGGKAMDAVAPAKDPVRVSLDAQNEATDALNKLELQRSKDVNALYTAAGPQSVDPAGIEAIVNDLRTQAAGDKTGLIGPRLTELADRLAPNGQPITDVENLDRLRKYYRDSVQLPPGSVGALNGEEAKAVQSYLQRLSSEDGSGLLDQIPEFAQGKAKYADISDKTVDPALAGPLGDISAKNPHAARDTPPLVRQTNALFPDAPPEGQAAVTAQALSALPNTGADLTRQHLARRLAEGSQDTVAGANQWGGAKFATDVAGNPEQAATLNAALGQTGGQQEVNDLLDVLAATGTRLRPGSETQEKFALDADLKKFGKAGRMMSLAAAPYRWTEEAYQGTQLALAEKRQQQLAQMLLSDPDEWGSQIGAMRKEVSSRSLGARNSRAALANLLLSDKGHD